MTKNLPIHIFSLKNLTLFLLMAGAVFCFSSFNDFDDNPLQVKEVKCYPNPATTLINFDFQKNIDHTYMLEVYSFSGKKMTEVAVSSSTITIGLNDYYRGIYLFQLRDKEGKIVESGKFQVVK